MATGDLEPRTHEVHTLVGAYVLDAVTDEERARFAAHLAGCEQCREEIRELREATTRLGTALAVDPRAELKRKTIEAARRIAQQAPLDAAAGWPEPAHRPEPAAQPGRALR